MGENEKKLLELQDAADWTIPASLTAAIETLTEIDTEYKKIASQNREMKGEAAEAASEKLGRDRKTVIELQDAFEPLDRLIKQANRNVDKARKAYNDLPDATIDPATKLLIQAGSFVFNPLAPIAATLGLNAYEAWLRDQREKKATEAVETLTDDLSSDADEANGVRSSMPRIRAVQDDSSPSGPMTWEPTKSGNNPGADPSGNPAAAPAPADSSPEVALEDEGAFAIDDDGTTITDPGPQPPVIVDPGTTDTPTDIDGSDTDDSDDSRSAGTRPSVDGSVNSGRISTGGGGLASAGHASSSHAADASASAGHLSVDSTMSSGVSGGLAGAAAVGGGSRLAAQLAAKTANAAAAAAAGGGQAGGGLAGAGGGVGGGLGGPTGTGTGSTGSGGGLSGRSGGASGAGARATAGVDTAEGRAGAGARGGSSVMAPGGGAGGADSKKRPGGLLGLKAPTLDDDGDPRARSSAAGPGGRGSEDTTE